ncbi:MAG: hypothetical protein DMG01_29705, partial [Acidobacteria bacterium]
MLCVGSAVVRAQFQMPDPKQMSGIPRPVTDLPDHAISVRLIRGELSNNIANHPVQLRIGSKTVTVKTDESGRAQFNDVTPGAPVKATADVDGEHLESQEFPAPDKGFNRVAWLFPYLLGATGVFAIGFAAIKWSHHSAAA